MSHPAIRMLVRLVPEREQVILVAVAVVAAVVDHRAVPEVLASSFKV
jgi:hypothetical protein